MRSCPQAGSHAPSADKRLGREEFVAVPDETSSAEEPKALAMPAGKGLRVTIAKAFRQSNQ